LIALFVIIFSGCKGPEDVIPQSNDQTIQELQQKVPFIIVIPTYLPSEIIPHPISISGPSKGPHSDDSIVIGINYIDKNMDRFIWIIEENFANIYFKPSNPTGTFLDILGINVLQQETQNQFPDRGSKEAEIIRGYYYAWVNNGINVTVSIYGYEEDESRKIISSMIK
jgi:hypothetical protein